MAFNSRGVQRLAFGKRNINASGFMSNMLQPNPKRLNLGERPPNMNDNRAPGYLPTIPMQIENGSFKFSVRLNGKVPPGETDNTGDEDGEPISILIIDMHAFEFGVLSMMNQMTIVMSGLNSTLFDPGDGIFRPVPILDIPPDQRSLLTGNTQNDVNASIRFTVAATNYILAHLRSDYVLPDARTIVRLLDLRVIGFSYLSQVAGAYGKRNLTDRMDDMSSNVVTHGVFDHAITGVNRKSAQKLAANGGKDNFSITHLQTDIYLALVPSVVDVNTVFHLDDTSEHSYIVQDSRVHNVTWQLLVLFKTTVPTKDEISAQDRGYRTISGGREVWKNSEYRTGAYVKVGTIIEHTINVGTDIDITRDARTPPRLERDVVYTDQYDWVFL